MKTICMALIIGCLSGCVTRQPVFNPYQVVSRVAVPIPAPKVFEEMRGQRSVARPATNLTVPLPPKPVYLAWDYPLDALNEVEYFKVYHSADARKDWRTWELYGTTVNLGMAVNPTNVMDFFYCTAYGFGFESMPNTK